MLDQNSSLAMGSPRFADSHLARLSSEKNVLAAWRAAFVSKAAKAANDVSGDFAVGLVASDGRTFLAVDRFAIRSMCYRLRDGQLHFAARADELADTETEIDPQAIYDYLYFHIIPSPRTIYKDIYRLPPGHYALFAQGQLTVAPYWVPTFNEQTGTSFKILKDEFRQLLQDAVAVQLDGSKPACFLSGGTDSSTVAGMAALASGETVATYSIGFDAKGYDEMAFAQLAAKHFQTEHHAYYVTPDDLVRGIPGVASHFDQPFGNSSALPAYYCAKLAHQDGVSKLLAGDGGDELFGGNSRYAKSKIFSFYDQVPGVLQKGLLEPLLGTPAAATFALTRKAGSYVEQARVPMPERLQMYNLIMRLGASEVLTPQLLAQVDTGNPLQLQKTVWQTSQGCSPLNQELAYDWRFTLAESDLPKVLGATRYAGVGVGFPLLDDRLLAFSQKLPSAQKLKGLQLRWFFKEALRDFLPEEILTKKKQGFGLPFGVWANNHPALKRLANDSLYSLADRGLVRADFVRLLLSRRLSEHPGYFGEMVWILMMLEQWLQGHAPTYKI
jgi:asparagine synthase (glutamine-hydrolysing)